MLNIPRESLVVACLMSAVAALAPAGELRWPRAIASPSAKVVIYQPQLESLNGDKLTARAAVSITATGSTEPVFGAMWVAARVVTDREDRTVDLRGVSVTDIRFPDATEAPAKFRKIIEESCKTCDMSISMDRFLTALRVAEKEKTAAEKFNNVPPKLLLSKIPAVLVTIDGEPKLQKVEKTSLMRVVNTPFFIVLDLDSKVYYLLAGEYWMKADQATGPWKITGRVPGAALALAAGKDTTGLTGLSPVTEPAADEVVPAISVATEPTELVVLDGEPEFQAVPDTNLLYVSNTDSDIFMDISTQSIYILISGRWFTAKKKDGPWTYVPAEELPKDFSRIPPGSAKADVRVSVPDTDEAKEAVADTFIPQTATIKRSEAKLEVTYDGDPKFEPIEGTAMQYAVNTASAVVKVEKKYYCCQDAVWFEADSPAGPWTVCVSVPREIYTLPPSCPIYQIKYVYVYDSTPEVVYVGYTPGYEGCFVYGPCVVYGAGIVYKPWYWHHYYPRPTTWGFRAHYNPATGNWWAVAWGRGPNGWVIHGGGGHWDNWHPVWSSKNLIADRGHNLYADREGAIAARRNRPEAGRTIPDQPRPATPSNNLFADREGSVYRKGLDGWEKTAGSRETPVRPDRTRLDDQQRRELDNHLKARSRGEERVRQFSQPSPSRRPALPSGGVRRGRR